MLLKQTWNLGLCKALIQDYLRHFQLTSQGLTRDGDRIAPGGPIHWSLHIFYNAGIDVTHVESFLHKTESPCHILSFGGYIGSYINLILSSAGNMKVENHVPSLYSPMHAHNCFFYKQCISLYMESRHNTDLLTYIPLLKWGKLWMKKYCEWRNKSILHKEIV